MLRKSFGLMVAIGVLGGLLCDVQMEERHIERAGYRVVEGDFHAHTRFGDGFLSPPGVVLQARRRGLDVISVTEHNMVTPGKISRWFSELIGGPLVLVGHELTSKRYHMHGVGVEEAIDPRLPVAEAIAAIHAQGGVAIAAHPVKRYWPNYEESLSTLDGTEVMHPIAFRPDDAVFSKTFSHADLVAFYERSQQSPHPLTAIGSSDYHFFNYLGACRTLLFVTELSREGVLEAIRKGRTVVYGTKGEIWGKPELIAALKEAPYPFRDADYHYRGAGAFDIFARSCALLGLFGLCFIRRREANTAPLS